ncbi:hypothetical protein HDU87_007367 [Geranomyces variabilis]|uniref:Survival Motor Neuron Gemin2-binding domain-containing protein n=1 Tax=Geranomyces variabilis TaxID=109894 RepID=A0AAD5XMS5_9FUNG|nr:hypothetical protein HDU87_007367 [Geranomyces variabilis]
MTKATAAAASAPQAAPPGDHDPQIDDEEGAWVEGEDADPSEDPLTQEREVKQQQAIITTHDDESELNAAAPEEYTVPLRPKAGAKNAAPPRPQAPRPSNNQNRWSDEAGYAAGSKRQKTASYYGGRGGGGGAGGGRSAHAEEWDDTALIEGWDAAVLEYQMFHSDQPATGGNIKRKKRPQPQPPAAESSAAAPTWDNVAEQDQKHAPQHPANGSNTKTANPPSYSQCASCGVSTVHASSATPPAFPGSIPGVDVPMGKMMDDLLSRAPFLFVLKT